MQATLKKYYSWQHREGKRSFYKQWQNFTFKQLVNFFQFYFLNSGLKVNSIKRLSLYNTYVQFSGVFFLDQNKLKQISL